MANRHPHPLPLQQHHPTPDRLSNSRDHASTDPRSGTNVPVRHKAVLETSLGPKLSGSDNSFMNATGTKSTPSRPAPKAPSQLQQPQPSQQPSRPTVTFTDYSRNSGGGEKESSNCRHCSEDGEVEEYNRRNGAFVVNITPPPPPLPSICSQYSTQMLAGYGV